MKEVIFLLFIVVLVMLFMLSARGVTASASASAAASRSNIESLNGTAERTRSQGLHSQNPRRWGKRAQSPRPTSANSREERLVAAGIRVPALSPPARASTQWPPEYNSASVVNPETTILRPPGSPRKRTGNLKFNPIASEVMYDVATGAPIAARAHVVTDRAKPSYA